MAGSLACRIKHMFSPRRRRVLTPHLTPPVFSDPIYNSGHAHLSFSTQNIANLDPEDWWMADDLPGVFLYEAHYILSE